jgi:hypothetical protein
MPITGHVIATSLNLRDGPNGDLLSVGAVIPAGASLQILTDFGDGWPLVKVTIGGAPTVGFVDASFIALDPTGDVPSPGPISPPAAGQKFTDSPNECVTTRTTPTLPQVVAGLRAVWSDLSGNGARALAAQFAVETGGGKACFNWNLGNVKSPSQTFPHMYLNNVWECLSPSGADAQIARADGLARIATSDEIKTHGWTCANVVVVFSPPHSQCRFRAYASLADGAAQWGQRYQAMAAKNPAFLPALNGGDVAALAHALKLVGYYTAPEAAYAAGLKARKADIDRQLGPVS